jgi:3-phenylpropionate/trans-cinnamate dioxygenase ferredoxin subunit
MTVVCRFDDLGDGVARRVEVEGVDVAVVRCGDEVFAIGDRCTHADVSLSEGELDCEARTLECWKHGSAFSLVDGVPLSLPATKATPRYHITVIDGDVVVDPPSGTDAS